MDVGPDQHDSVVMVGELCKSWQEKGLQDHRKMGEEEDLVAGLADGAKRHQDKNRKCDDCHQSGTNEYLSQIRRYTKNDDKLLDLAGNNVISTYPGAGAIWLDACTQSNTKETRAVMRCR